ncbi:MAG: 2-amino-4-hydroxy-6-hydroxymethyldihydropteridine diphosphokinase [Leptolyngbyaceae cyanobacterium SM1_1_3]|nr:2-amino-4-hydroxy-6-hydroxymethyldihydropteridine diphosphokinase [Leptolyngbyaceae cyanobacterium SM1_1_3]NJO09593.1 2-amino-4-hydroxy-6-hydroxymethyldihydropteridine diphosphokinase [Leptolyngbyaceae cyanobacterium SL_1_1]
MTPCAIALGSNLGNSLTILQGAVRALAATASVTLQAGSKVYKTAPVGPPQPDYLNACVLIDTQLSPEALLTVLLKIENCFGRIRRQRWGPRLLDLDLLLFDQQILATPTLQLPHPRMHERAFVLVPLAEIAADWIEPVSGKAVAELLQQVDPVGVQPTDWQLKIDN